MRQSYVNDVRFSPDGRHAYTKNAIVHNGRLDAGVDLLGKPFTRDALAKKIRGVLART